MSHWKLIASILLLAVKGASAHFVFILPDPGAQTAQVVMSEELKPDEQVPIDTIAGAKLFFTDMAGRDSELSLTKQTHALSVALVAGTPGVIHGIAELGVMQHGKAKPNLLTYYPKTIVGNPFDPHARLGQRVPIEVVPRGSAGQLKLQVLISNKPATSAEINLLLPDGSDQKLTTDSQGCTKVLEASGRYGAWTRDVEPIAGEQNGKHYDEVRHYATLVIDVSSADAGAQASDYSPLPQPASSFGAVACDNWLYVYGGHIANTHSYSTASVSGEFHRLNLVDHHTWETLAGGPPLQGMNLAAWHGKIFRVGGMCPHNKPGEEPDVRSVNQCASFDSAAGKWTSLAALPQPRSSHDVAVVGDKLIVVGGWNLNGVSVGARWSDTAFILDLADPNAPWKTVKQPFHRRALIAAAYQNKVYCIGGFEIEQEPNRAVEIYDPSADHWTHGPALPGADQNGFGPAACVLAGRLYVSVADGTLYRLNLAGDGWDKVATTTPRIVHRLAPNGSDLLVIGGAMKQKQVDLIEAIAAPHTPEPAK